MSKIFVSKRTEETICTNCGRGCETRVELGYFSPGRPGFAIGICPECAKRLSQSLLAAAWKEESGGKEQGKRD